MNVDTGEIKLPEEMEKMLDRRDFIKMNLPPEAKQLKRLPPRVGRNEPCPCGSGLKFKKCHLRIL